jgi:Rieske Fe-S protein
VRFSKQAEFHPREYLLALAERIPGGACEIFEETKVTGVSDGSPCRVETAHGTITANDVVVATHMPFLDRGFYFARVHPERSYVVAVRLRGAAPQGMYLSTESPTHSIRSVPTPDGELLLVGGESHKTGQSDEVERYEKLEAWARERFDVESVEYRWATQDNMPVDGIPFVGRLHPFTKHLWTATGYKKWGLANGTAAGMMLADLIAGRENAWAATFDSTRLKPVAAAKEFVLENANVARRLVVDYLKPGDASPDELAPGEGGLVRTGLTKAAAFRDEDGVLHARSATCTHMGCNVQWNAAERTWDCPCHGSRFGTDGEVIQGPAVDPLGPAQLD